MQIAAHCQNKSGVLIGRTNHSFREFNNTIVLSPSLIASKDDIDEIVGALDSAFTAMTF
jgi:taurine-pyruvate aminotransferase